MSFYLVPDNPSVFFVESQEIVDENKHLNCVVGTVEDAENLLATVKQKCLEKNNAVFLISKEEQQGQDVTWIPINTLDGESDSTVFQLFDTTAGQYVRAIGKEAALNTLAMIKERFLTLNGVNEVRVLEELPRELKPDPFANAGEIPVGVM